MIDDALGNNLGHSFPKIDKLDNGVAVSIKSIKLSDKTYETAKGIYNKLRRDVDAFDDFTKKLGEELKFLQKIILLKS